MNEPNYPQEAADLLAQWRNGEDVQDAMAHKLRHMAAGCATLSKENAALRADKARLDWLDRNPRKISNAAGYRGEQDTWSYFDAQKVFHDAPTIRAAIDAARAALEAKP